MVKEHGRIEKGEKWRVCSMIATIKVQLLPTKEEEDKFFLFSNTSRFIYNKTLAFIEEHYHTEGYNPSLQKCIENVQDLKYNRHKEDRDYSWLQAVPEAVTKQAIKDLKEAYKRFFEGVSNYPRFKKKGKCQVSFYQRTDKIKVFYDRITITGVGRVKYSTKNYGLLKGTTQFMNPRVTFDGKYWYLTFGMEVGLDKETKVWTEPVGIDLGVKTLAVTSKEVFYENVEKVHNKYRHYEKRLKRQQRKFSRQHEAMKKEGRTFGESKNIAKTKKKIKLLHRKLKHIRETYYHTITAEIVKTKPSKIVVEDLNVKGMMKNRHLAKSIAKQSFYTFKSMLKYKCEFYKIEFKEADRFYPSSKLCSCCGHKKDKLSLSERIYSCEVCGTSIDRDLNAAINLSRL